MWDRARPPTTAARAAVAARRAAVGSSLRNAIRLANTITATTIIMRSVMAVRCQLGQMYSEQIEAVPLLPAQAAMIAAVQGTTRPPIVMVAATGHTTATEAQIAPPRAQHTARHRTPPMVAYW